jgi:hypothetical protein
LEVTVETVEWITTIGSALVGLLFAGFGGVLSAGKNGSVRAAMRYAFLFVAGAAIILMAVSFTNIQHRRIADSVRGSAVNATFFMQSGGTVIDQMTAKELEERMRKAVEWYVRLEAVKLQVDQQR